MNNSRLSSPDAARRRFAFRQGGIMVAFALSVFAATLWVPRSELLHWLVIAAPLALLALWAWEFFKSVRDDDEMMQALALRAISFSALLVLLLATMWGLLEVLVGAPHLPSFLLLPAFAATYGVSATVMSAR
jgi:ABC-type Mn2+/Zn2+ transport system permease subunit